MSSDGEEWLKAEGGGFHEGERAVQAEEGLARAAARLEGMLDPADLGQGASHFLSGQVFAAITGRSRAGRLWVSPLVGDPGFIKVKSPTRVRIDADFQHADPLYDMTVSQPVALIAVDYLRRRRFRINGTLVQSGGGSLEIAADEAFGNCPQFIPQRRVTRQSNRNTGLELTASTTATWGDLLSAEDQDTVERATSFILGTTHAARGNDASHRGGPAGFVRIEGGGLWWPDYAGNNMFNSLGNLRIDPSASLLFPDFARESALRLSGRAKLQHVERGSGGDDGRTGRRVVFAIDEIARTGLGVSSELIAEYSANPRIT